MTTFISIIFLFCGLSALTSCQNLNRSNSLKVVGGEKVTGLEWQSVVLIVKDSKRYCSGSLIHPKYVLTAGHCVVDHEHPAFTKNPERFLKIYIGNGKPQGYIEGQHAIKRAFRHPDHRRSLFGLSDFALLELKEPINDIEPITLAANSSEIRKSLNSATEVTIVGFGRTEFYNPDSSGVKHKAKVPLQWLNSGEVGLGKKGVNVCNVDSGGPAFLIGTDGIWKQFGVTSRGPSRCGATDAFSVFGLASVAKCWIEEVSGVKMSGGTSNCGTPPNVPTESAKSLKELCANRGATKEQNHTINVLRELFIGKTPPENIDCNLFANHYINAKSLNLSALAINDLSPLAHMKQLEELNIEHNRVTNLSPILKLSKLKRVKLGWNHLSKIDEISELEKNGAITYGRRLQKQNYWNTPFLKLCKSSEVDSLQLSTIVSLREQFGHEVFESSGSGIGIPNGSNTNSRVKLASCEDTNNELLLLKDLYLRDDGLRDLSPLAGLENIQALHLGNNKFTDIAPIGTLNGLKVLDLGQNQITNRAPLQALIERNSLVVISK